MNYFGLFLVAVGVLYGGGQMLVFVLRLSDNAQEELRASKSRDAGMPLGSERGDW